MQLQILKRAHMGLARRSRLLLVGLVALLALAISAPALAAPPEFQTVPFDLLFIHEDATNQCGFPVQVHAYGTLKISTRDLQNGSIVEIDRYIHVFVTFTNLSTGASYTSLNAGPNHIVIEPDGKVISGGAGRLALITLPRIGMVLKDVGRFVYDQDGNIIFQPDKHPLLTGGDLQGLCMALS